MRKMKISFPQERVTAIATLLDNDAPKTCDAIWNLLKKVETIEDMAMHAMWSGPEIYLTLDKAKIDKEIGLENSTITPLPGDVFYCHMPTGYGRGYRGELWEICVCYGPDTSIRAAAGFVPVNIFAKITENFEQLVEVCKKTRVEGVKKVVITRLE